MWKLLKYLLALLLIIDVSFPLADAQAAPPPPPPLNALFLSGERHISHWEIDRAEAAAAEILSRRPDSPQGLYLMANVRFHQGRYKEAMDLLEGPPQDFVDGRGLLSLIKEIYKTAGFFVEYHTEHFVIRYVPGKDEVLLEDAAHALERAYGEIGGDLGYLPGEQIILEIYPSVDGFSSASTLTRDEIETSGTVAICHFNRLMIMSPRLMLRGYPWLNTLAHEYVHYVITKRTRNLTPIWFHEGLAKYEESRWRSESGSELSPTQSHLLAQAQEEDYFITFEQMHPSMAKLKSAEDAALAFAEVLTAMRYIVDKGGYPALNKALDVIATGADAEEAVEVALGMPFSDFERDWKSHLRMLELKKIPGLKVLHLKIKKEKTPGISAGAEADAEKEESPAEIEAADARKFTILGDLLEEEGRPDAALFEYQKAQRHAGLGSPQILNKLARAYMQNHRDDAAQGVINDALTYYPNYVTTYITQGELLAKHDEVDGAIDSLISAGHINPFNPVVHRQLSQLYSRGGDKENAQKSLKRLAMVLRDFAGHKAEVEEDKAEKKTAE
jgi:tetratricopeptide (TPR) repeat protein